VKEPGSYKIVWDNSYSWFTGKTIRYRVSVMKPLSDLDVNRRVDFELLKRNMSRDQHKKNEENKSMEMSIIETKPEDKKLLLLKYEGKERVYYPVLMQSKEEMVKLYPKDDSIQMKDAYISIPLLLSNQKLRVYDPENVYELDVLDCKCGIKFVKTGDFMEAELEKDSARLMCFIEELIPTMFKKVI
jgi:hypothetical protein